MISPLTTGSARPPGQSEPESQPPGNRGPRASRGWVGCVTGVGGLRQAGADRPSQLSTNRRRFMWLLG
jgi:hypothetical protein